MHLTDLLATVLRTVREPAILLDDDNRIRVANEAFAADVLSSAASSVAGQPLAHVAGGRLAIPGLLAQLDRLRQNGLTYDEFEVVQTSTPNELRRLSFRASRLPASARTGSLILLTCLDLQNRDAGPPRLLPGKGDEIIQSQKMETVGRLAGSIAHDFNNLLTAIVGYAEMLRGNASLDQQGMADVDEILKAGTSAAALTSRLLTFSRKKPAEAVVIDLNDIVHGLDSMLRRLIGRHVLVCTELSDRPALVRADAAQIEQLLLNLAVNARDAMPDGGRLSIRVSTTTPNPTAPAADGGTAPGRFVQLSVEDTGCGMSEETLPRIFEPFFTLKEPGRGTGLGLATVYEIVQHSRGSVTVRSAPGHGTVFDIFLPAADTGSPTA